MSRRTKPTAGPAREVVAAWTTEAEFQQAVIEQLQFLGFKVHAERSGMTSRVDKKGRPVWVTPIQGDPGFCDIVAVRARDKRLLFLELKKVGEKPTEKQQGWLDVLEAVALTVNPVLPAKWHVLVAVLTPANWDTWLEVLE